MDKPETPRNTAERWNNIYIFTFDKKNDPNKVDNTQFIVILLNDKHVV